jgi:pantetheine-phosphate adenylyltransferase
VSEVVAILAGTFDPVTRGHLDLMLRARALFGRVVVSVAADPRPTLFDAGRRAALVERALAAEGEADGFRVEVFRGLVVEQARRHGARVLVRGIRGPSDLEHELRMAGANRSLAPWLETVLLPPSPAVSLVSSTLVREVASLGGEVSAWVPAVVLEALRERFPRGPTP